MMFNFAKAIKEHLEQFKFESFLPTFFIYIYLALVKYEVFSGMAQYKKKHIHTYCTYNMYTTRLMYTALFEIAG